MGCEETAVVLGSQRHQLEMDRSCEFAKFHKVLASLVAITTAKDHDTAQGDYSRLLSGYSGAMLPPPLGFGFYLTTCTLGLGQIL